MTQRSTERLDLRRVAAIAGIAALAILLLALFVLGIRILLAAFGGVLFGVMLNAISRPLARSTPLPYRASLAVVVLGLLLLIVGGGFLIAPQIAEQAQELGDELPALVESVEASLEQHPLGQWVMEQARSGRLAGDAVDGEGMLSALSGGSTYILIALLVGLFGAGNPRLYRSGLINLVPLDHRPRAAEIIDEVVHTLQWWLIGQAIAMVIIGVSTGVMLWLFGIPFALLLGIIVGLLGFIPFLGPLVGVVPIALVTATQGVMTLLWVMVAYTGIQMLEGYVAMPLIHHQTVYLPPVFTIISQILLGAVVGVLGVIMATPLAAVVLVLSRYYRSDLLGDPDVETRRRS